MTTDDKLEKLMDAIIRSAEKLTRLMNHSGADDVYRREEEAYTAARVALREYVSAKGKPCAVCTSTDEYQPDRASMKEHPEK